MTMADETSRPDLGRRSRVGGDGDLEVFVADEQAAVPVDTARWARLAEGVLVAEGVRGHAEISLLFVGEDDIAILNEEFLGQAGPTDVLAFPIDGELVEVDDGAGPHRRGPDRPPPDPGDLPLLLGDVVVCPGVAARQAETHAGTVDDELALLVVHGLLHVLGHDHAEPAEHARMRAREIELLQELHWNGPAPAGFRQDQPG
jgi:probable rRNA maturation factor